jgi:hypothetical protein
MGSATFFPKRFIYCSAFIIIMLLSAAAAVYAQTEWHLKKEEEGIKVYTRNTPNSNFKSIKVEFDINSRLSQIVAFLLDVDRQTDWIYNSAGSRLIKKPAANEIIFYSEINLPWPCTNRDYISHVTVKQPGPGFVTIEAHSEPDLVPVDNGKVRVKVSNAFWEIIALNSAKLRVDYVVQFDPAGSLPAWLVNMFIAKAPIQTFRKLREAVNKPEYINAHLDFIKE